MYPFFVFLKKEHIIPKVTSYGPDRSHAAAVLQKLIDDKDQDGYRTRLAAYVQQGLSFRLTDMKVYETKYEGETLRMHIALQVRGCAITWYFWAPDSKDQYPQEYRDKFYNAANECHAKASHGCDLYYRGSNAYHVKTMHHLESEADYNHNHYRFKSGAVSVKDFSEHMQGFKNHPIHDEFFESGEIDEICSKYEKFQYLWSLKNEDGHSYCERYEQDSKHRLTAADIIEFELLGLCQEPCRINVDELTADFNEARAQIESSIQSGDYENLQSAITKLNKEYRALLDYRKIGGSRGLGAERAMARQVTESHYDKVAFTTQKMDDLGVPIPSIPEWANSVIAKVSTVKDKSDEALIKLGKPALPRYSARLFGDKRCASMPPVNMIEKSCQPKCKK